MAEIGLPRRPCAWAALHAGVEFMTELERAILAARQFGLSIEAIGIALRMDPLEVERNLARTCRTLATWERNACKWSTRYVALEPNVAEYGDNREPRKTKRRP